jgi:hypothetical protein
MRALIGLVLVAACVRVTPYIAVVEIENPDRVTYIGAVRCDVNGRPYELLSPKLTDIEKHWVLVHEARHLAQIKNGGGCRAFLNRYAADSMFRLAVEADAYCTTLREQQAQKVGVDPDLGGIVWRLQYRYAAAYERSAILAALPCA